MADALPSLFTDPSTLTPLFTAEWVTCAYPISDVYSSSPRYLYYMLLIATLATQWHAWLANVFLGVAATYAGTAAIEAFILIASAPAKWPSSNVTIANIDPSTVAGNLTLREIPNLVTGRDSVNVAPFALEFDIDAVLAITVTGYLVMLPVHCWSSAVRANRARHLLIFIWNALMLAGVICALQLWPRLFNQPLQYRFCYPSILDSDSVTSDGMYSSSMLDQTGGVTNWNSTIWSTFQDFNKANNLTTNCLYPCFATKQILRRANTLVATVKGDESPRLLAALDYENLGPHDSHVASSLSKSDNLAYGVLVAIIVTTAVMIVMLAFMLSPLRNITRTPVHSPKLLFTRVYGRELFQTLWFEFKHGIRGMTRAARSPVATWQQLQNMPHRTLSAKTAKVLRFLVDIFVLLIVVFASIVVPGLIIVFVVWVEVYIHRDLKSDETPQQVGQWNSSVSLALVLVSAAILRLQPALASEREVVDEIDKTARRLTYLEGLLEKKKEKKERKRDREREQEQEREQERGEKRELEG